MSESPLVLAILKDPTLLFTLIPLGVIFLGVLTFELAMAVTISTLPRSRMQHKWTPQEQRRVVRVFVCVFSVWPIGVALVLAHLYLPVLLALLADALVLVLVVLGIRWLRRGVRERRLIQAGHCVQCFYDLRASHAYGSEHCPECGTGLHDHPALSLKR